jgi:hypothetical protein
MTTCVALLLFGSAVMGFLFYGPKDYLIRVPAFLTTVLHPWILAPASILCTIIGLGGLLGLLAGRFSLGRPRR